MKGFWISHLQQRQEAANRYMRKPIKVSRENKTGVALNGYSKIRQTAAFYAPTTCATIEAISQQFKRHLVFTARPPGVVKSLWLTADFESPQMCSLSCCAIDKLFAINFQPNQ